MPSPLTLVTNAQMREAEKTAIAGGIPADTLMENAGASVARAIVERFAPNPTVILCGPGNNGGDGWVVARLLAAAGWPVRVAQLGAAAHAKTDSAIDTVPFAVAALDGCGLVVDALFGSGLSRALDGAAKAVVEAIGARNLPCVAVDIPSGVDGDTGLVLGAAPRAQITVAFARPRPGHSARWPRPRRSPRWPAPVPPGARQQAPTPPRTGAEPRDCRTPPPPPSR